MNQTAHTPATKRCQRCKTPGPVGAASRLCVKCANDDIADLERELGLPEGALDRNTDDDVQ